MTKIDLEFPSDADKLVVVESLLEQAQEAYKKARLDHFRIQIFMQQLRKQIKDLYVELRELKRAGIKTKQSSSKPNNTLAG